MYVYVFIQVSMHVYMYTYAYLYVYIYTTYNWYQLKYFVFVCVRLHVVYACTHEFTYACMYSFGMHVCVWTRTWM